MKKPAIKAVTALLVFLLAFAAPAMAAVRHTVKPGESLYLISKKYKTSITALKNENGLTRNTIYPGQVLRIPAATPSRNAAAAISKSDIEWLARAVYGEARGEPFTGQVAVAAVILNRVESSQFPDTIKEVIFEPLAFTAVADGQIYLTPNASAYSAARAALNGLDPTGGALYYWNPARATNKWIWSRPIIKRIGNHVFAR